MAPILAGVVILGFAIGGAISLLGHRGADGAAPLSTPAAAASPTPLMAPSDEPTVTPEPSPSPSSAPTPKPVPSRPPVAVVTPLRATAEPSASPAAATPEAVESAAPSPAPATPTPKPATPKPVAAVKPDVSAKPVAVAPPVKTAAPVPVKAAPTTAPVTETADSDFARQSAGVVRAYLTALARGDDTAAEAALDAPTGSREASLTEKEFAGPDMRIARIEAHGTGDSARVDVDLLTAKGAYFAQFFVKKSASGAPLIVDHDFIKP